METTTTPTTTPTTEIGEPSVRASLTFLRAKQTKTDAGKAYDSARQTVIDAFAYDGVEVVFVDDHKIECVPVTTREFDVAKLEALIPASVLRDICRLTIDPEKYDEAVKAGLIAPTVEAEVVTPKHSVRVDVRKNTVKTIEELVK